MYSLKISVVLLAMAAAILSPTQANAQRHLVPEPVVRSGPAFELEAAVAAIEAGEQAHLLVSLALPAAVNPEGAGAAIDLASLKEAVADVQQSVIAAIDPGVDPVSREAADFKIRRQFDAIPALAITVSSQPKLDLLLQNPAVIGIQLDAGGTGTLASSVPSINADERHAVGNGGEGVIAAVIDTGVDLDHPDLVDDILQSQACFGDTNGLIDGASRFELSACQWVELDIRLVSVSC